MAEPTPVLIIDDEAQRSTYTAAWNTPKSRCQAIVDFYDTLGLDPLTPAEFGRLFNDTPVLIFDKLTGGELTFGGVAVDKTKALEIVQKPAGYETLLSMIAQLAQEAETGKFSYTAEVNICFYKERITDYFMLDEENTVQFSASHQTMLSKIGKVYATTAKQIAMWQFCQAAVDKYFELGLHTHFAWMFAHNSPHANPLSVIIEASISSINVAAETPIALRTLSTQ